MLVELHGEDRLSRFGETVERLNPKGCLLKSEQTSGTTA